MRRRIKRQLVRLSYSVCGICLICCLCLTGCRKETKNAAVQDTILAMEKEENPGMAGSSDAINSENQDAGKDQSETAAGEEKESRDKETDRMNRDGAEEEDADGNHEEMEKRSENGSNAGQTTGAGNEKAPDGTGEAAAKDKAEIRDWEQSAAALPEEAAAGKSDTEQPGTEQPGTEQHSHSFRIAEVTKQPGCMEPGSRTEICTVCGISREADIEALGHDMVTQWYGDPPDCTHGGYQAVLCVRCGWVDEAACGNVPALEHIPIAVETQHGNCREDTIIIYTCSQCGEQTGYERHTEPDEHKWVWKDTLVWDEEACEFVTVQIECCERCNIQP